MNNSRRKQLKKALALIEDACDLLTEVRDEEESAYDNLPDSLQMSDKGDTMQENIDNIDEAISSLEDAQSTLESIE